MVVDNDHNLDNSSGIKDELSDIKGVETQTITPKDLLIFAKSILIALALLFFIGAIIDIYHPNSIVFEACKTILPPIATLVIGYYFGKT